MIQLGLIGAGWMGEIHARNLYASAAVNLAAVADTNHAQAERLSRVYGSGVVLSANEMIDATEIDAVIIATPADTHGRLLVAAAKSGKAVYCEKPLAKNYPKAVQLSKDLESISDRIMVGFNRRFDPTHAALKAEVESGLVGEIQMVRISSRGPNGIPPIEYLQQAGGLFRDKSVHYFDLLRWLTGEEVIEVSAMGSVIADEVFLEVDDFDTGLISCRMAGGALVEIDNCRRASYGYDDRIEIFGTRGLVESSRPAYGGVTAVTENGIRGTGFPQTPQQRYGDSWVHALSTFAGFVEDGAGGIPSIYDGVMAQALADAATLAAAERRIVTLQEITGG